MVGYAYACEFNPAPRLPLVGRGLRLRRRRRHRGDGLGRALYRELFERLRGQGFRIACAGITLPNPASVGLHEASASSRSAPCGRSAGRTATGSTSAGGSCAEPPAQPARPRRRAAPGPTARPGYHWPCQTRAATAPEEPLDPGARHRAAPPSRRPGAHSETPTEEDVYEALEEVIDPELGLDFVSLGLVYDVEIEKEDVYVTFTLTTPACPIGPQVSEQMKEFVGDLPGVSAVHPKMVFDPAWSPEMMTDDAKFALGF